MLYVYLEYAFEYHKVYTLKVNEKLKIRKKDVSWYNWNAYGWITFSVSSLFSRIRAGG